MRKVITAFVALLVCGAVSAQTIVSTSVEKRNVILEEYTSVRCGYCPDGHAIANGIVSQHDGHAWAINIHEGGYATGSGYTTTYGDALAAQYSIQGYPCGTVNRGSMSNRGQWASQANNIRQQDSPVNVAAVGNIDVDSRTVTLHIEVYYTSNSAQTTNLLNVAVTQNNILGQQSNYGNYNSEYIEGNQYRHMHMLRTMLTGQWGVPVHATAGSFFDTTIVYQVPESIGTVPINDLGDLEFIVFVTETHKNILSGTKAQMISDKPSVAGLSVSHADCDLEYQPYLTIANLTEHDLTSFTVNYNGEEITINKNIASLITDTINLPTTVISVTGATVQHCATSVIASVVSCETADGETIELNSAEDTAVFADFDIYTTAGPFNLRFGIDHYGSECGVELRYQASCEQLLSLGPWTNLSGNPRYVSDLQDARYTEVNFSPAQAGLYILRATDSYGDGWYATNNTNPAGFWLNNADGEVFGIRFNYQDNPIEFSEYDVYLNVTNSGDGSQEVVGIDEHAEINVSLYPNPVSDKLYISAEGLEEVSLIDMAGRTLTTTRSAVVDLSSVASGVYMVRVVTHDGAVTRKVVKE